MHAMNTLIPLTHWEALKEIAAEHQLDASDIVRDIIKSYLAQATLQKPAEA